MKNIVFEFICFVPFETLSVGIASTNFWIALIKKIMEECTFESFELQTKFYKEINMFYEAVRASNSSRSFHANICHNLLLKKPSYTTSLSLNIKFSFIFRMSKHVLLLI